MKTDKQIIERLEYFDGGENCTETERWIDEKTDTIYSVPVEIVRHFDKMEKL
tara:strand:+ start:608 stop:763 length:156 start_codon:yes stop_codon:yes gene_type:complete